LNHGNIDACMVEQSALRAEVILHVDHDHRTTVGD